MPGAVAAASVTHPAQPEIELVTPGVPLTRAMLRRMAGLDIRSIWICHDATADLDKLIDTKFGKSRRAVYDQLKTDFSAMSGRTLSTAQVFRYTQLIREFVLELMSNPRMASLAEHLIGGPGGLFTHSANVAYLCLLTGLQIENYIVMQRPKLSLEHAKDLTSLGVGAMLHDIGKTQLPPELTDHHGIDDPARLAEMAMTWPDPADAPDLEDPAADEPADHADADDSPASLDHRLQEMLPSEDGDPYALYQSHAVRGYLLLRGTRAPASATQIVLNHHQRWDGRGFPDVTAYATSEAALEQQGPQIHVLTRIVTAANVLDNLLRGRADRPVAPAAALCALAGDRFKGVLDPVVRDAMLRVIPPFAVGEQVKLSDGRDAVVVAPSVEQPCRPAVRLLSEADRLPNGRYPTLDLRLDGSVSIAECGGEDVRPYLFTLKERKPLATTITPAPLARAS